MKIAGYLDTRWRQYLGQGNWPVQGLVRIACAIVGVATIAVGQQPEQAKLQVLSTPESYAAAGSDYVYQLKINREAPSLIYQVKYGPKGMKVSQSGLISWSVPTKVPDDLVSIVVAITHGDATLDYKFNVAITGAEVASEMRFSPDSEDPIPNLGAPTHDLLSIAELTLPAKVSKTCVGADGRLVFMHLPALEKVAVFDTYQAKIVRYIRMPVDAIMTAGRDCLVAAYQGQLYRWDDQVKFDHRVSLSAETTANQGAPRINNLVMGASSSGPILLSVTRPRSDRDGSEAMLELYDGKHLTRISKPITWKSGPGIFSNRFRASPDGQVFTAWTGRYSAPSSVYAMVDVGPDFEVHASRSRSDSLRPTSDGRLLLGGEIVSREFSPGGVSLHGEQPILAFHGPYYAVVSQLSKSRRRPLPKRVARLYVFDESTVLGELKLRSESSPRRFGEQSNSPEVSFWLLPKSKLFLQLTDSRDRLVIYPIDVEEAVKDFQVPYLFFDSVPSRLVRLGSRWQYPLSVRSGNGGVKLRMPVAPDGASLRDEQIEWSATQRGRHQFTVIAADGKGNETHQTFQLYVY